MHGHRIQRKRGQVALLQQRLPHARVVYCSATGASEPRHLSYMGRLGLWGRGAPFKSFEDLCAQVKSPVLCAATRPLDSLSQVEGGGVGVMEAVAMHLKSQGAFLCRSLSFAACDFELVEEHVDPARAQYSLSFSRLVSPLIS